MSNKNFHVWLHRIAVGTLVFTILMTVGLGGVVTSAEVGMAYPTWPNINAQSLFNFFYGSLADDFGAGASLEHTHRQAGSLLGLLSILLVLLSWRTGLRKLALLNLFLVIIQGLIGAFRVLENTQTGAIVHALGAQVVIVILTTLAMTSARNWPGGCARPSPSDPSSPEARLRLWSVVGLIALFFNLLAAASLRHKAGAFSGHLVLALTATAVLFFTVYISLRYFRHCPTVLGAARRMASLLGIQIGLGLGTWAFLFSALAYELHDEQTRFLTQNLLATAHLIVGVVVMSAATALVLEARHRAIALPLEGNLPSSTTPSAP
jgi:heme a synthase